MVPSNDASLARTGASLELAASASPLGAELSASPAGTQFDDLLSATTRMTELNASYNVRYLQLQQAIQADTRQFNLLSNVLKTKHEAAKNALANLR